MLFSHHHNSQNHNYKNKPKPPHKMKLTKEYITIFLIMITEVMGFSLILPYLPLYVQELGASPLTIGLILTSFSICQFISAPIMGRLSDHYGRKPMMIFSQFSTFLGFVILGAAKTVPIVILSRVVDGILGSNMPIAQAYLSDLSSKKDRSKIFGLSGAAFGFGFLVGPAIGGFLSKYGFHIPAYCAAGLSLVTILITTFFLKETIKRKKDIRLTLKVFHFNHFRKYFSIPALSPRLYELFTYVLSHSIFVSTMALYLERQLGFGPTQVGYMLTYVGGISIILRLFLLPKLIDYFGEHRLQYIGVVSIIIAMLNAPFVASWPHLLIMITLFAWGSGLSRPVMVGSISRSVSEKEQGAIMGLTNSLGSLATIVGPLIGGFMINYFFPGSLGLAAGAVMAAGMVMMIRQKRTTPKRNPSN
jgi:DHA1 family tetracycline resistance protein-like MFS transporter